MRQVVCPNCNGSSFKEEVRFLVCEYCGSRLMKDRAKAFAPRAQVSAMGSADSLLRRADAYWESGNRARARDLYRQVLDIDASVQRARERSR